MNGFQIMVVILLVVYVAGLLVLGFFLRKRAKDLTGFLVAQRKLPVLFTALSLSATIIGASMTFAAVTNFYKNGLSSIWFSLGPAFFLLVMGLFLAKRIRASKALTLPDLVEKLFDTKTRMVTAVVVIMAEILWIAVLATATRDVLAGFLGIDPYVALFLSMTVFTVYTIMAGKVADAYTDVIQFFMMVALVVILVPAALLAGGGDVGKLGNPDLDMFAGHTPLSLFSLFILLGLSYLVGPDVYAAILSAKDQKVAQRSAAIGAAIILGWGIIMALLGLMAKNVLGNGESSVMTALITGTIGNQAIRAVLVAGLIAVLMSSVDTTLLTGGSVFSNDLVGPVLSRFTDLKEEKRQKVLLWVAKVSMVPIAIAAVGVGVWLTDMIEILYLAYLVFIAGVVLPVVAGLFKKQTRVTNLGAIAGLVFGGGSTVLWYFTFKEGWVDLSVIGPIYDLGIVNSSQIIGLCLCVVGMVVVSILEHAVLSKDQVKNGDPE